jgi:DNA-binding GntR family transcriptional regulator
VRYQPDLLRPPAEPGSLMDRAYRTLKRAIIELDRPPGSGFTEQEIARSLGLSKTPVREALARLHRDGLVTPLPRAGYVVSSITLADAADLYDLRTLLQSEAAARCADTGLAPAPAHRLTDLTVDDQDSPHFDTRLRHNYEFETIIANGAGNARLAMAVVALLDDLERVARLVARLIPALPPARTRQRIAITEAILARDPVAARAAMHARGDSARDEVLDILRSSPAVTTASIPLPPSGG